MEVAMTWNIWKQPVKFIKFLYDNMNESVVLTAVFKVQCTANFPTLKENQPHPSQ